MTVLQMILRGVLVYAAMVLLVRVGKKRFMGAATAFDVILGFMIGSVASRAVTGNAPVDYLVAFATGERHFPYRQIGGVRPAALHPVLLWAALGWHDARYRDIAQQIGGGTARLELTFP